MNYLTEAAVSLSFVTFMSGSAIAAISGVESRENPAIIIYDEQIQLHDTSINWRPLILVQSFIERSETAKPLRLSCAIAEGAVLTGFNDPNANPAYFIVQAAPESNAYILVDNMQVPVFDRTGTKFAFLAKHMLDNALQGHLGNMIASSGYGPLSPKDKAEVDELFGALSDTIQAGDVAMIIDLETGEAEIGRIADNRLEMTSPFSCSPQ